MAAGPSGCGPVPGWSGRCGGRAASRVPQVQPFLFAVPAFGEVEREAASAVAGGAGGDGDQVAADRRPARFREGQAGQRAGRADQVVCHRRDGQPRGVRGEDPGGHVSERAAGDVGEDLLHARVVAVLALGLDQPIRRIGEDRVVTPDREQLVLPGGGLLVQVPDPADDQPGGDRLVLLRREGGVLSFGDLGVGDPGIQLVVPDRLRVLDRRSSSLRRWRRSRRGCCCSSGR